MPYDLTPQQIFDKVVIHLYTQKKQAINKTGLCKYRMKNGLKCAIGALIEDDDYQPSFDKKGALSVVIDECKIKSKPLKNFLIDNYELLLDLQHIHDSSVSWDDSGPSHNMFKKLRDIAMDNKFDTKVLLEMAGRSE